MEESPIVAIGESCFGLFASGKESNVAEAESPRPITFGGILAGGGDNTFAGSLFGGAGGGAFPGYKITVFGDTGGGGGTFGGLFIGGLGGGAFNGGAGPATFPWGTLNGGNAPIGAFGGSGFARF